MPNAARSKYVRQSAVPLGLASVATPSVLSAAAQRPVEIAGDRNMIRRPSPTQVAGCRDDWRDPGSVMQRVEQSMPTSPVVLRLAALLGRQPNDPQIVALGKELAMDALCPFPNMEPIVRANLPTELQTLTGAAGSDTVIDTTVELPFQIDQLQIADDYAFQVAVQVKVNGLRDLWQGGFINGRHFSTASENTCPFGAPPLAAGTIIKLTVRKFVAGDIDNFQVVFCGLRVNCPGT